MASMFSFGEANTAGNSSFRKYQFGVFTGTFNTIQNVKCGHTAGYLGTGNVTGFALWYSGTTTYTTPATGALAAVDMTLPSGTPAQTVTVGGYPTTKTLIKT